MMNDSFPSMLPLASRCMPRTIAFDIVLVQPMSMPKVTINFMDIIYQGAHHTEMRGPVFIDCDEDNDNYILIQ